MVEFEVAGVKTPLSQRPAVSASPRGATVPRLHEQMGGTELGVEVVQAPI